MEAVVSAPEMIFFTFASLRIATVRTAALSYLSARFSIWNDSARLGSRGGGKLSLHK